MASETEPAELRAGHTSPCDRRGAPHHPRRAHRPYAAASDHHGHRRRRRAPPLGRRARRGVRQLPPHHSRSVADPRNSESLIVIPVQRAAVRSYADLTLATAARGWPVRSCRRVAPPWTTSPSPVGSSSRQRSGCSRRTETPRRSPSCTTSSNANGRGRRPSAVRPTGRRVPRAPRRSRREPDVVGAERHARRDDAAPSSSPPKVDVWTRSGPSGAAAPFVHIRSFLDLIAEGDADGAGAFWERHLDAVAVLVARASGRRTVLDLLS